LFDMPGFVVRVHAMKAGEWWLQVETTADRVGCRSCGVRAVGRGRRRVEVRDLPIAGRPVGLVWAKRVWRCVESLCATATWTEQDAEIGSRASLTRRARIEICRRVGEDADSVAQVARQFGVGWHTAMAAVREHGERLVDNPERLGAPAALGLDETSFLRAGPKHPTVMITGFVDLDRHQLVDVAEGRSGQVVRDWLDQQPAAWVQAIDVAVIDPFRGYATGLTGPTRRDDRR
jgi:transposase